MGLFDGDFLVGLGHHLIWEDLRKLQPHKYKQLLLPDEYAVFFRISLLFFRLNVLENPRKTYVPVTIVNMIPASEG